MYKNILVGIAFHCDDQTRRAIDVANLLRDGDGTVTLLHIVEDIPAYAASPIPTEIIEKTQRDAKASLQKLAEASAPGAKTKVIYGHSGRTLVNHANTNDYDCMVIASHRPEFTDYLLGSTANLVSRHADCSVHIVR